VSDHTPSWPAKPRPRDLLWVERLVRVFPFELICPQCGGRLSPVAVVIERGVAARVLRHLDLAEEPPKPASARARPGNDALAMD
jgi:hypothetical protein